MSQSIETTNFPTEANHLSIKKKATQLLAQLCDGLYEREEPMTLALLATVSGETIFLLGPPGVGKSLVARRLKFAFEGGTAFEYLMSKFSTPDEIFGPISIKKLKDEDKYERLTDKYLPGASIVFLDEIWKAGPAIQNALLTILNERIYRNGEQEIPVNVKGIITASNELPPQRENFAPIWDRFLVRLEMTGIREQQNFLKMITDTHDLLTDPVESSVKITEQELEEWSQQINQVTLPPEVLNTIQVVKYRLEDYQAKEGSLQIYDRRWKKIVRLLRTAAFLNGRSAVNLLDCFLMTHCLWHQPAQLLAVREIVAESIRKHGYSISVNLNTLKQELNTFEEDVHAETRIKHTISENTLRLTDDQYYQIIKKEELFQGVYIKAKDFRALTQDGFTVTNFYDDEFKLVNRLKSKKSIEEHAVLVSFNGVEIDCQMVTQQSERAEYIFKKPHGLLVKHWEQKHKELYDYIKEQLTYLKAFGAEKQNELKENLFVATPLSDIVFANLNEVTETLEQLELRLEKLEHGYTGG